MRYGSNAIIGGNILHQIFEPSMVIVKISTYGTYRYKPISLWQNRLIFSSQRAWHKFLNFSILNSRLLQFGLNQLLHFICLINWDFTGSLRLKILLYIKIIILLLKLVILFIKLIPTSIMNLKYLCSSALKF